MARHRFAAADFANAFVGLALDAYGSHVDRQRAREIRTHLVEVRQQPGLLSDHRDIDVLDPIAAGVNDFHRSFQQLEAVRILPLRRGIRKQPADVTTSCGPKDGIGDRVAHDVGVGMTDQTALKWDANTGQNQRPVRHEPMQIVPRPDSRGARTARVNVGNHAACTIPDRQAS